MAQVTGMTGEGLSLADKAKLGNVQIDAREDAETIRGMLFPPDEAVA